MIRTGRVALQFLVAMFLFLTGLQRSHAQGIKVQSYVDRNPVQIGDSVTLTVELIAQDSVEASEPKIPNLEFFELINTWTAQDMSSQLVQTMAGNVEFQTTHRYRYNFMLTPKKSGTATIEPFEFLVAGKIFKTQPLRLQILGDQSTPSRQSGNLAQQDEPENEDADRMHLNALKQKSNGGYISQPRNLNEAFFVQVEVDKTEAYEGEQIVANWYVLARGTVERLERLKFPTLKGFWKEDIDAAPQTRFTQEIVSGVLFQKAPLASHALFPISSGEAIIDEYKVKATIRIASGGFGIMSFGKPYNYTKPSERIKIKVKPLPIEGRPAGFSGAVGDYQMTAQLDAQEAFVGQPISLKIKFEGYGNAKLIDVPAVEVPSSIEVYGQTAEAQYDRTGASFKLFDIVLIPKESGEFVIPAVQSAVFNPSTNRYEEKKSEPLKLTVKANPNQPLAQGESFLGPASKAEEQKAGPTAEVQLPPLIFEPRFLDTLMLPGNINLAWWAVSYFFVIAFGLAWNWKSVFGSEKQIDYVKIVDERMRDLRRMVQKGNWRLAAARSAHLSTLLIGRIAGQGGGVRLLKDSVESLPPRTRKAIEGQVYVLLEELQHVGFAPEEVVANYAEKGKMSELLKRTEKLLKTVAKGVA